MLSLSDKRKERNCALSDVQGIFLESELLLALHCSLSMFLIMFSFIERGAGCRQHRTKERKDAVLFQPSIFLESGVPACNTSLSLFLIKSS